MRTLVVFLAAAFGISAEAALERTVTVPSVGDVRLNVPSPDGWTFALSSVTTGGVDIVTVRLLAPAERRPPVFTLTFGASGAGATNVWTPYDERYMLRPDSWGEFPYSSSLAFRAPIATAFGDDRNRLTIACSEAIRKVQYALVANANTCRLTGRYRFFTDYEAPLSDYSVSIRIDRRGVFWGDAVSAANDWISACAGLTPCTVPAAAFEPLYSSWYAFGQDVRASDLEREASLAASLGLATAILDDGWQKERSRTFYSAVGDWQPARSRFPDMRGHVAAVHRAGLRYLLWIALPFVGDESAAWPRLKDKFLFVHKGGTAVFDPRYREVREHLTDVCVRAVRDWGFDGLKLDFIDQFSFLGEDPDLVVLHDPGEDPAVRTGYAGRDIRSLPVATDRLMKDILAGVRAVRPEALIEFRQQYMGPAIRQYGNIIRATDCPADPVQNRRLIADLRLTSGTTAVHSDMLVWSPDETPEGAARAVLSSLFGVQQYSMVLGRLPESHRRMVRHWIGFTTRHRGTLLRGVFRPHHPELFYPLVEAESDAERIVAVYGGLSAFVVPDAKKSCLIVNATAGDGLFASLPAPASIRVFDTFGTCTATVDTPAGPMHLAVPKSGYAEMRFDKE